MFVKILKDVDGSPNGYDNFSYKMGKEYEIPDDLAEVFIKMGRAEKVEKKEPENKSVTTTDNKGAEKEKDKSDAEKEKEKERIKSK